YGQHSRETSFNLGCVRALQKKRLPNDSVSVESNDEQGSRVAGEDGFAIFRLQNSRCVSRDPRKNGGSYLVLAGRPQLSVLNFQAGPLAAYLSKLCWRVAQASKREH